MTVQRDKTERNLAIVERRRQGAMLREIADGFGLSVGRVSSILQRCLPPGERRRLESEAHRRAQDARHTQLRDDRLAGAAPCSCPACNDSDCHVKPWTCHHCSEPVRPARSTRPLPRQVKGHPTKYCSRSCAGAVKRGRAWGSLGRELLATAGACGTPGCSPTCPVPPGRCHRKGCDRSARIAGSTNRGVPSVRGYPLRHCSLRCERLDNKRRSTKIGAKNRDREERCRTTLRSRGLVPIKAAAAAAAPFLHYSPLTIEQELRRQGKAQHRAPNGLRRDGVYVDDLLGLDINGSKLDTNAKKKLSGRLNKIQSARKGTKMTGPLTGPTAAIDAARNAKILELRASGRSYRAIGVELGVSKSHAERVVKAAAVPKP